MGDDRIKSRLYVEVEAGPAAADRLAAAFGAADIASVLIRPPQGGALDAQSAQPLVAMAQGKGAAVLLADNAELARVLRADGVHLSAGEDPEGRIEAAREILGGRAIIGADPGRSRHDAMTLAELGADYMAFGPEGEGDVEARDELAAWWAEIFEIPCVVLGVATSAEAVALQAARCEFIGLVLPSAAPPDAARAHVAEVATALAEAHARADA